MAFRIKYLSKGFSLLGRSGVVRGASAVAIGTALGQAIATLASPAITRLYTPYEIGWFATLTALTNLFVAFVCLRLEQVILIADEEECLDVVASCLLSILAVMVGFALLVMLLPRDIINVPPEVRDSIAVLGGLTIGSTGLYQVCQHLVLREQRLMELARYQVTRSLIMTALQLGLGLLGFGFLGLAGGQVFGLVVAVLPLIFVNRAMLARARHVGWRGVRQILSKYRSFPLYGAPQSLLNATTFGIPVLMIGAIFGTVEAAIFWLGFRVFGLPSQVIIESVRASLLSSFSQKIREGHSIMRLWTRSTLALGALMLPLPLVLGLVGHQLFAFVFGKQWAAASTVTMILSFAWIAQNARVPSVVVLQLSGRQRLQLVLEVIGTIARTMALSAALLVHNFYLVLVLFVMVNLTQSIVTIRITMRQLKTLEAHADFAANGAAVENAK